MRPLHGPSTRALRRRRLRRRCRPCTRARVREPRARACGGSHVRTRSPARGVPSLKRNPGRSLNVYVRPSGETRGIAEATSGTSGGPVAAPLRSQQESARRVDQRPGADRRRRVRDPSSRRPRREARRGRCRPPSQSPTRVNRERRPRERSQPRAPLQGPRPSIAPQVHEVRSRRSRQRYTATSRIPRPIAARHGRRMDVR